MKRVIKAAAKNVDMLQRIEDPNPYDADWQEHRIQEIADYLDPYGIEVEVDGATDRYVYFITYSPQYTKVSNHLYCVCSSGVIYFEPYGDRSTYNDGSRRGYNAHVGEKEELLYKELYIRFNVYCSSDPSYIEVAQSYMDEIMDSLDNKYGIHSDIVVSKIDIHGIYDMWLHLDNSSLISIRGYQFKIKDDFLYLKDYNSRYKFLQDMTPASFKKLLYDSDLSDVVDEFIYEKLRDRLLRDTDILPKVIQILNDKLDRSKYDAYLESFSWRTINGTLTYSGEEYSFEVDYYSDANLEDQAFDLWFDDTDGDGSKVIDYLVRYLYKRITAKCRRIISKINKDLERVDQEARDSAML